MYYPDFVSLTMLFYIVKDMLSIFLLDNLVFKNEFREMLIFVVLMFAD